MRPAAERQLREPDAGVPRRPGALGPYHAPVPGRAPGFLGLGQRLSWVAGLVLGVSAFTDWYAGHSLEGPPVSVIGWHTGTLGKLVFFAGLAVVLLALARQIGVELPPSLPQSLVVAVLGALATVFVLIRVISIPDTLADTASRGIGIWISLAAGVLVIVGGLLQAAEEL